NLGGTDATQAGFLDNTITQSSAGTAKSGYLLTYSSTPAAAGAAPTYTCQNTPITRTGITRTGNDSFFVNETGVITHSGDPSNNATSASGPIE
ncbi:MAG TPA: hypothetical protein PKZ53_01865, partial [Acidobacteriota bacterium]|nr:hypothetical protein [Acidobacteriota bacterium]